MGMLHPRIEAALAEIIDAWLDYDDARREQADLLTRTELRMVLERLRSRVHDIRRSHHPTADEISEMAFATYCDSFDATLFIPYRAVHGSSYVCGCGEVGAVPA